MKRVSGSIEGEGISPLSHKRKDYLSEQIRARVFEAQKMEEELRLIKHGKGAGIAEERLREIVSLITHHFVRTDTLAQKYQRRYFLAGDSVYRLAAGAVCIAALQGLFFPSEVEICFIEVLFMAAILCILFVGKRGRWHEKWMDYRFLAERFRAVPFLYLADVDPSSFCSTPRRGFLYSPDDWVIQEFSSVHRQLPKSGLLLASELERIKQFTVSAWVEEQIAFHMKSTDRYGKRHDLLHCTGVAIFAFTLIAALSHTFHLTLSHVPKFDVFISFFAISLPAIGSTIGAIRANRDFQNSAMRSRATSIILEGLRKDILEAVSPKRFRTLLLAVEETILRENEEWKLLIRCKDLEIPA